MDARNLFKAALEQATAMIKCVENSHFRNPTPCTDWDCRTLVNHMLYELLWVPDLLEGKTIAGVGSKYDGDLVGSDLHHNWHIAAHKAANAVNVADVSRTVHLSYADVPAENYIKEIGGDILIHAWDVGQSLCCSLIFDTDVAQAVYDNILPRKDEFARSGLFCTPINVPQDANIQTKLLALVGRSEP